jgi:hypothetical protein
MKKIYALFVVLILVFSVHLSNAQSTEKTRYMIWEVQVSPQQLQDLINAIKTENALFKEKGYSYANVSQYTNDGYLWYSVPFTKYAELDDMENAMNKFWKENQEKMKEIGKMFETSYSKVGRIILESQPELSVQGEQQDGTPGGSKFRFFEKFYLQPGAGEKFEELIKKYVELRKKHEIKYGFSTFYPVFAQDMDVVYFIDDTGNSPAEHFSLNEEQWKKFGDEGGKLWQAVVPLVRNIETHLGQINYDLMYVPAK